MTREALASRVGITYSAVRKVEEAENEQPTFSNGLLLARALGCWPDEISFERQFPSDLAFDIGDGVEVEIRLRFRGNVDGVKQQATVRTLREIIGEKMAVEIVASDAQIAEARAMIADMHDRISATLERLHHLSAKVS